MTDYEKIYQTNPAACGEPFAVFVDFFKSYPHKNATVLDLGCGQGRDAVFIGRLGHSVHAVDISPSGIAQLVKMAAQENLAIHGETADIVTYQPQQTYAVVLLDRVIHMLATDDKIDVLKKASAAVESSGYLLIADTPSNLPLFDTFFDSPNWNIVLKQKGFRFLQKLENIHV